MKKLRKASALLVAMTMVLSLIPQAVLGAELVVAPTYTTAHEAYLQGWVRDTAIAEDGTTIFTCVTDEIAHSGDHSFVLKSLDTGDKDLALKQTVGLGEGTYTLSFWAAGTAADHDDDTYRDQQMVWLWGSTEQWAYLSNMYTGEKDGDWAKYTLDFTVPAGSTVSDFKLSTRGHGTEGLYIDDFTLVKQGTTNNLLKNGSFDFDGTATYTTEFEPYFQGWERDTAIAENGTTIFTCVTDEIAHSGNHSFVLKSLDTGASDLAFKQAVGLGEGTYTLSFWAAGTAADHDDDTYKHQQMVWLWGSAEQWAYLSNMYTGEKDGDWAKYTLNFTVPAGATVSEFKLSTRGHGTTGLYIDDISIVKSGTTNNILTNGGFEGTESGEEPDVPEGPTYTTEFEPYFQGWVRDTAIAENGTTIFTCVTDEIAHSGDHSFVLKSLDTGDKDLALKQTVGLGEGTYTLSFWATGTAADLDNDTYKHQQMVWLWGSAEQWAYLSNMYTGEKDGDWTKYTLNFTVPAGATVSEFKLSTRGHGTEGLYIDDISIVASGSTNNLVKNGSFDFDGSAEYTDAYEAYFTGWARNGGVTSNTTNVFACVTDAIAHSGEHSVVLKHTDSTQGGYMQIQQTNLSISEGTYTLSFWVAGEVNGQQVIWIKPGTTTANGDWLLINSAATGETDGDWTKYSTTFNVASGNTVTELTIGTSGNTPGLYLDDISIVASGSTNNLVKNGSFDSDGSAEYTDAYEDYFAGWARNGGVTSNTTNVFACVTDAVAHSGEHSVVLKHTDSTQGGYMQIQQTNLSIGEGTYTLSFWVSGEVNGQQVIWIKPGTTTANGDWLLINSAATGETEGAWTKYSTTFNVESGNTVTELTFGTSGNTPGLYIDDISIVASGSTNNLVKNGSFDQKGLNGYYVSTPNDGYHVESMWYDYMRSIKDAPVINSEDHIIPDRSINYTDQVADYVAQNIYMGAIHGRAISDIWVWERSYDETSDANGSVLHRPDVIAAIGKETLNLNRNAYEITALQNADKEVGILYSDSSILSDTSTSFALYQTYAACLYSGKAVQFVTPTQLKKMNDCEVLIVPQATYVTAETLDYIKSFIESGGNVMIIGQNSLKKNEKNDDNDSSTLNYIYE